MKTKKKKTRSYVQLNVTDYNEDTYFRCFPEATEEDYIMNRMRTRSEDYLEEAQQKMGIRIGKIRYVVIDNAYFEWLEQEGKENSSDARITYMASLSDEEVEALWLKNERDWGMNSYFLPVIVGTEGSVIPSHNLPFSFSMRKELKRSLALSFHLSERDIFIHSELMRLDYYYGEFINYLEEKAYAYFDGNDEEVEPPTPLLVKQDKSNIAIRAIPMVIRQYQKPILTMKELKQEPILEEKVIHPRKMEQWTAQLKKMYPQFSFVSSYDRIIDGDEVPEFYEEFMESMQSACQQNQVALLRG